jgi:hypothetical protein
MRHYLIAGCLTLSAVLIVTDDAAAFGRRSRGQKCCCCPCPCVSICTVTAGIDCGSDKGRKCSCTPVNGLPCNKAIGDCPGGSYCMLDDNGYCHCGCIKSTMDVIPVAKNKPISLCMDDMSWAQLDDLLQLTRDHCAHIGLLQKANRTLGQNFVSKTAEEVMDALGISHTVPCP